MKRTFDITPEPEGDRQALFLNTVAERFYAWEGALGAERQAHSVSVRLTPKAKNLISALYYFANKGEQ